MELVNLLTGNGINDYMTTDENTVKGFFKALVPHLIEYSILEYQERKKIASKYNIPYNFLYHDGEVFTLENLSSEISKDIENERN